MQLARVIGDVVVTRKDENLVGLKLLLVQPLSPEREPVGRPLVEREGRRLLIGGDTALTDAFASCRRFGAFDAAVMPIGAYDPWIMNHMNPEQVWQMFVASGACYLVPVHWDTFRLGKEPLGDAIARLVAAAGPEAGRIVVRNIGETWTMPLAPCTRS